MPHRRRADGRRASARTPDDPVAFGNAPLDRRALLGPADASPRERLDGALTALATLSTRLELAAIGAESTVAAARTFAAESVRALHAILAAASPPTRGSAHTALIRVERFRTWLATRDPDERTPLLPLVCDALAELLRDVTRALGGGR